MGFGNSTLLEIIDGNLRDAPRTQMLSTQLLISVVLGLVALSSFSLLRAKFPNIFMARLHYLTQMQNNSRNKLLPPTINQKSLFSWLPIIHSISDDDIIQYSGLDAFVFLSFFKMSIKLLWTCWLFSVLIISPVRYYFTGDYDQGEDNLQYSPLDPSKKHDEIYYQSYLWLYVFFTYLFTLVALHFLMKQSRKVIDYRQRILGKQNSITDRTIRLSGIPPELRTERALKETVENLKIGKVEKIVICKEWKKLDMLFNQRNEIVSKLEGFWTIYLGNKNSKNFNIAFVSSSYALREPIDDENRYHDDENLRTEPNSPNPTSIHNSDIFEDSPSNDDEESPSPPANDQYPYSNLENSVTSLISTSSRNERCRIKLGWLGLFGKCVDAIDYYTEQLSVIDDQIDKSRKNHYPATPTAFITMDSVATAQTLAQAVLDPRIGYLISNPAPAPSDIIWDNVTLSSKNRKIKIYYITVITGILCVMFIVPVSYLATLLNMKSIRKFWPALAEFLDAHPWTQKFVIDLVPVYLYTLLNTLIPFLYVWLSSKQGFVSHGEEELSVVSKNFFYVFVNLFLVFTMAGTASNYWGYLSDSKKLALQLAQSLRGLSSFYIDTIVLQGIGLMPFKLLLMGRLIQFPFLRASCRTPRDFKELYKPPTFNFGLQLPHPLLTLIITLLYSVMSTKILSAGLVYFIIGYYVFKFQLIYSTVHPQHSTGKVMPIIFRRVILGLLLFQLTVAGSLALSNSYILSMCLFPLPLFTLMTLWYFQEKLQPLSYFIALRAIEDINETMDNTRPLSHDEHEENNNPAHRKKSDTSTTIDERRELNQSYEYPYLVQSLDGPWLNIEGDRIVMWSKDGIIRKKFSFEEI